MPNLTPEALSSLVAQVFGAHGMSGKNAVIVADVVVAAERDGAVLNGLFRIPGYVSTLKSGWVDGQAEPLVSDDAPGIVHVDARNGYSQPALAAGRAALVSKARSNGIAFMSIHNSHHFGALWPDVEPFAEEGLVAMAFVNSRSRVVPWGGKTKLFGTNPMAFACPQQDGPPAVWDQASSVVAGTDLMVAEMEGRQVAEGIGVDAEGRPTTLPKKILEGGAQLTFGGHKGSMIALLVEVMAAALTGGRFGFEDASASFPGGESSNAGEAIIVIDPQRIGGSGFLSRTAMLFEQLSSNGQARLPGSKRHAARARALEHGIDVDEKTYRSLLAFAAKA